MGSVLGRFKFLILFSSLIALVLVVLGFVLLKRPRERDILTLYGNVDVRQVDIAFRVNGRVKTMPFDEGDFVTAGMLMATLEEQPYADRVLEAKANVESIRASLTNAESVYRRRAELVPVGGVSVEDYESSLSMRDSLAAQLKEVEAVLKIALLNLDYTQVYCPVDGTILTRVQEPGAVVLESDPVYTLSISSPVWVRAYVNEPDLGLIYPGMPAKIVTDTKGSSEYKGQIGFISPIAEFTPKTVETAKLRTDLVYRIRVTVENPNRELKQGMPVTVHLLLGEKEGGRRTCPCP